METTEKKFYNVPECARFLECSDKTIRRLIEEKKLLAHDIGAANRRVYRIPVSELERFLSETANLKRSTQTTKSACASYKVRCNVG